MEDKLDLSVPSAKAINLPGPYYQYDPPAGTILTVAGWGTKGVSFQSKFCHLRSYCQAHQSGLF